MLLVDRPLVEFALRVGAAILVLIVGRWLAHRARTALIDMLRKTTLTVSMTRLLVLLAYYSIVLSALMVSLALVGFPITALLAALLIVAVIVGIALRELIANLAATIIFMLFQPFKVGELIRSGTVTGTVKEIQLFSTVLLTWENMEVTLPNAKVQADSLFNYTRTGLLREDLVFNVSYQADLEKVKRVLHDLLKSDSRVLADPAPQIFILAIEEYGVQVAVRPAVKSEDYWDVKWALLERVKQRFDAEGISIPYPQRDVHLFQAVRQPEETKP